jgi:tetratricopeptide (TPR) repeat protein
VILFLALFAAQAAGTPPTSPAQRLDACVAQARTDPAGAEQVARTLGRAGEACRGVALAGQDDYAGAATAFTAAARNAELAKEARAADYWAQAGNAWLAAGDAAKARAALDAALAAGTLTALNRGEAYLDRARALVATGDMKAARVDLDLATKDAADDPLAWLLSATLARRMGDLPRAKLDIAQALRRSADDASVQLEAGNIAAAAGEADRAQAAWKEAARLAPDAPAGRSAANALTQFAGDPKQ